MLRGKRKVLWALPLLALLTLPRSGRLGEIPAAGADLIAEFRRAFSLYTRVLRIVEQDYCVTVDKNRLFRGSVEAMVGGLDPWSWLVVGDGCAGEAERYAGPPLAAGMALAPAGYQPEIVAVLPGSPAAGTGLAPGDRIVAIDGVPTAYRKLHWAVAEIERRRAVALAVTSASLPETVAVTINRPTVGPGIIPRADLMDGSLGYLRLNWIGPAAADSLRATVAALTGRGARGIIIDLRGSPGGLLDQGLRAAGLFLATGATVAVISGRNGRDEARVERTPEFPDLPLVLITDRGSAGAAELLAAALAANGRATVVGERTRGHGSVQTTYRFDGPEPLCLRLTTAGLVTPSGKPIESGGDGESAPAGGVEPDIPVGSRDVSAVVRRLKFNGLFHRFAAEYPARSAIRRPDFRLPERTLHDFARFLNAAGFAGDPAQFEAAREEIGTALRGEFAALGLPDSDKWTVQRELDPALNRAAEELSRALSAR